MRAIRLALAVALCSTALPAVVGCGGTPVSSSIGETNTPAPANTQTKTVDEALLGKWVGSPNPETLEFAADGTCQVTLAGPAEGTYTADGSTLVVTVGDIVRTDTYTIKDGVLTIVHPDGSPPSLYDRVQ